MYDILLVNQLGGLMRISYPIQVDPLTIIHQLCLQANSEVMIMIDDVEESLFVNRGSRKSKPSRVYRIESIGSVLLNVIIDEQCREIDIGDYVARYGFNAANEALQKAINLTLRFDAKNGRRC